MLATLAMVGSVIGVATANAKTSKTWQRSATTTSATGTTGATTLLGDATPQIAADRDTKAVELGVKFRSSVDGQVTGAALLQGQ